MTEIESQLSDLVSVLKSIDGEMAAIAAYENVMGGVPASRTRRASGTDVSRARRTRRRRRGSRRAEVLSVIASFGPSGVGRGGVILALNVKGNRAAEQSVSTALAALKKTGSVAHRDGKYIAAPANPVGAETPASSAPAAEPPSDSS